MTFSIKDYKLQLGDLVIDYNKECGLITEICIATDDYEHYNKLKFSATPGFLSDFSPHSITVFDIKYLLKRNRLVIHTRDGYKIDFKGRRRINKQNIF